MAKKGLIGSFSAWAKGAFGAGSVPFRTLKAVGRVFEGAVSLVAFLKPSDIAYRIFPPVPGVTPGYVVRSDRLRISGIAFPKPDGEPAEVELRVRGVAINRTYATQKVSEPTRYRGRGIGFNFPMKQVWGKIRSGDPVEVVATGGVLRFGAGAGALIPKRGVGAVEGKDIVELVAEGRLINKFGRIQPPRHESGAWAERALGNYGRIDALFEREFGKRLFVFYGAMLGFAREGGILAHDLDLDLAYFSEATDPVEVRREFKDIARKLIALGTGAKPETYKITFPGSGLSVTPTWIADGVFASTFGYVGDGFLVTRDDILPLSEAAHLGYRLLLPRNPKAVAAYVYGKGWKYPDPGWKWLPEYKDRPNVLAGRLTDADLRELAEPGSGAR